jgi:hypothetical protein
MDSINSGVVPCCRYKWIQLTAALCHAADTNGFNYNVITEFDCIFIAFRIRETGYLSRYSGKAWLDDQGLDFRRFFCSAKRPPSLLCNGIQGSFPEVKRLRREADL